MSRTRRIAAVGAVATVGLVVAARRRRRIDTAAPVNVVSLDAHRPPTHVGRVTSLITLLLAPIVWLVTVAAWPWDDVIEAGKGFIGSGADWIRDAIQSVVDWVWGYLVHIYNTMNGIVVTIARIGRSLATFMVDITISIAHAVTDVMQFALQAAANAAYSVLEWAANRINEVIGWTYGLVLGLLDEIARATRWVLENVAAPLYGLITSVISWVEQHVIGEILGAISWLLDIVAGATTELIDQVRQLWHFVFDVIAPVWSVLERFIDLLVAVVLDPEGFVEGIARAMLSFGRRWVVEAVTEGVAEYGSVFEDWFEEWAT